MKSKFTSSRHHLKAVSQFKRFGNSSRNLLKRARAVQK